MATPGGNYDALERSLNTKFPSAPANLVQEAIQHHSKHFWAKVVQTTNGPIQWLHFDVTGFAIAFYGPDPGNMSNQLTFNPGFLRFDPDAPQNQSPGPGNPNTDPECQVSWPVYPGQYIPIPQGFRGFWFNPNLFSFWRIVVITLPHMHIATNPVALPQSQQPVRAGTNNPLYPVAWWDHNANLRTDLDSDPMPVDTAGRALNVTAPNILLAPALNVVLADTGAIATGGNYRFRAWHGCNDTTGGVMIEYQHRDAANVATLHSWLVGAITHGSPPFDIPNLFLQSNERLRAVVSQNAPAAGKAIESTIGWNLVNI